MRIQRDDIIRTTTTPYLVLRSGAGRDDAVSLVINADIPSVDTFSTEMAFAIGSSSGEWGLFSEENYRGEVIILKVDEGEDGQGVHFDLDNFIVRAAYQEKNGSYLSYDPGKLSKYIIKNNGYSTLSNIKIRLSGKNDVTKSLPSGQSITIDFNKDSQGPRCMMMYDGALIQQVDFNDRKSADDLDLSEFNGNPTSQARYNAGDSSDEQFVTMKSSVSRGSGRYHRKYMVIPPSESAGLCRILQMIRTEGLIWIRLYRLRNREKAIVSFTSRWPLPKRL